MNVVKEETQLENTMEDWLFFFCGPHINALVYRHCADQVLDDIYPIHQSAFFFFLLTLANHGFKESVLVA